MVYIYIFTMAAVTYLIRMIPLTIFRKKITNTFVKSFLYYVPYACLMAMTFPAVMYETQSVASAAVAVLVAVLLALWDKGLMTVAVCASIAVFIVERLV
ncbi:MAG: AzlD domain-containing protein [Lachnospiraceae bacterium]|nr:AzlD domain-containing protein [Lachnospiraceae bacterium]MEE0919124.1 AzlD domain-containing protein [Lachnospiraceae bacterium]